jgi:hypothetical protein
LSEIEPEPVLADFLEILAVIDPSSLSNVLDGSLDGEGDIAGADAASSG